MTRLVRVHLNVLVCGGALLALSATPVRAQQPAVPAAGDVQQVRTQIDQLRAELDLIRKQYDERLFLLEQRLRQIGGGPLAAEGVILPGAAPVLPAAVPGVAEGGTASTVTMATPAAQAGAPATQTAEPGATMPAGGGRVFNPDTSVIGNFLGVAGKNPVETGPAMQLTEAEVAFQAVVDPYARGDFFLAAGPEGLEVEEGYITFTSLPRNFLVKAGKMRAQFGKVNTLHTHAMPTADRPLVTTNLMGGEEGLSDSGISVSRLFSNPHVFLEAVGEVYAGAAGPFQGTARRDLTYVGRLRGYRDLTEDKNLDLGVSYAFGPAGATARDGVVDGRLDRSLVGIDVTYRYRPLRRALYSRLNVRSELIWSREEQLLGETVSAFGAYGLAEWQFARRWYLGGRLDRSARAYDGSRVDKGGSVFLTFWPTEFSQARTQFRRTIFAEGVAANEALFQLNFSIGAHGAHVF